MKAKEMFEKLGYTFCENHHSMFAIIVYRKDLDYIYFDSDKKIDIKCFIDVPLLKAINKQVEELGWLDE